MCNEYFNMAGLILGVTFLSGICALHPLLAWHGLKMPMASPSVGFRL